MAQELVKKATIQPHTSGVFGCAISPDGTMVATGGGDMSLCITNSATQAKVYKAQSANDVRSVAWSPDWKHLVAVTKNGSVIQVANNNSHATVYKTEKSLFGCAFSPRGILAVGGNDQSVTLLDPSKNYEVIQTLTDELNRTVTCLAFSPDGNLLVVGCSEGFMYIYQLTKGKWAQESNIRHHSKDITSLCFSPSGRMLLATSEDATADIWNVSSGTNWSSYPHFTFKGHTNGVTCGAFLGDESHVVTGSRDSSLRVWRTSDGVQTANYKCGDAALFSITLIPKQATSLSYHASSGNVAVGLADGRVQLWQTDPYGPPPTAPPAPQAAPQPAPQLVPNIPLPAHACVRERLAAAQAEADGINAILEKADMQRLKRSIAALEAQLASERKALMELQAAEKTAEARELNKLLRERHNDLLGIINVCTQTLDSLTDCLSYSGLEDVRANAFQEWLCDIGLGKLQTALKDIDGQTLMMLNVDEIVDFGVKYPDAADLQLRGYMAHYKLSDDRAFTPPRDSVLSWTVRQTANWIRTLGAPYACLATVGWHGAALCSLAPPRIVEVARGALKAPDAVKFLNLVKAKRGQEDGDKDEWVTKWSGANTIEIQAI